MWKWCIYLNSTEKVNLLDIVYFDVVRDFFCVFYHPFLDQSATITTGIAVVFMLYVLSIYISRSLYFRSVSVVLNEFILSVGADIDDPILSFFLSCIWFIIRFDWLLLENSSFIVICHIWWPIFHSTDFFIFSSIRFDVII